MSLIILIISFATMRLQRLQGEDGEHRVGSIICPAQHPLCRGIVEVPLLLTVDRTAPAHQMIEPIILQGSGDPSTHLAGGIAPTVITSGVVDGPLARTGGRGSGLGEVAQLMGMRTIYEFTIDTLPKYAVMAYKEKALN